MRFKAWVFDNHMASYFYNFNKTTQPQSIKDGNTMTTSISTYEQQAIDFLTKTNCEFTCSYLKTAKHFDDDKEPRDIYQITLKRGNRSYSFEFGQSINNSGFYYTKGRHKISIDRKHLGANNLKSIIAKTDYSFRYNGTSDLIHIPTPPTSYDVLSCLQKNEVGTFENFCMEFGYDEDSRKAEKTYKAVSEEYFKVCALFSNEELNELQEIN